jgi:hypothetical protein
MVLPLRENSQPPPTKSTEKAKKFQFGERLLRVTEIHSRSLLGFHQEFVHGNRNAGQRQASATGGSRHG